MAELLKSHRRGGVASTTPPIFAVALSLALLMLAAILFGFVFELLWGPIGEIGCSLLRVIIAFAGGFSAYFMGGVLEYRIRRRNYTLRAIGGVAVFLLLYLNPPFVPRDTSRPEISVARVCGAAAGSGVVPGFVTCEVEGSIRGLTSAAEICAEFNPKVSLDADTICTVPSAGFWHLGPFELRASGQTREATVELHVVARDVRRLHRKLAVTITSIRVPAPVATISSFQVSPFCLVGNVANIRNDERIVAEATPLAPQGGTWFLPVDLTANKWSACDRPDYRVPGAPKYRIVLWLGVSGLSPELPELPADYALLTSYTMEASRLAFTPAGTQAIGLEGKQ
jgi:hypothetical protein